jgi:hypothetical protein
MAEWNVPYRFNVCGIEFDVTFVYAKLYLEQNNPHRFYTTLAFARKVGSPSTLAAKAILNPKDKYNYLLGQKKAFEKLINFVWAQVGINKFGWRKDFSTLVWKLSFDMGMWNMDEE